MENKYYVWVGPFIILGKNGSVRPERFLMGVPDGDEDETFMFDFDIDLFSDDEFGYIEKYFDKIQSGEIQQDVEMGSLTSYARVEKQVDQIESYLKSKGWL